ncbi:MAG TPA: Ig-like domain-containing protein, partial [Armatimonadota bacterium]|nr:Ig-like domain-containing protein [Armatimonadota bacterium]
MRRGRGWRPALAALAVVMCSAASLAEGALISGGQVADMVFSVGRQTVYMTSVDAVMRFDVGRKEFLEPFPVAGEGTRLMGLALSPDESLLVVADANRSATDVWVHLIDLSTDAGVTQSFPAATDESGTHAVAFAKTGIAFITSRSKRQREGRVPMRRLNPRTGEWDVFLEDAPHATMVSASADGSVIGFAGTVESDGALGSGLFGRIRVEDGDVVKVERKQPAWDIAVNADGTQFALPGIPTTMVYDAALAEVGAPADPDERRTTGAAYHPSAPFLHVAPDRGKILRAFDSRNLSNVGIYLMKAQIQTEIGRAFETGRLRVARDGSLLMCTVADGLWLAPVDDTPWAPDQALATATDTPVAVTLTGSTVADAKLTFRVDTPPEHGTLTGTMGDLRYVPDLGYVGADRFAYRAHSGDLVSAAATVSIEVAGTAAVASTAPVETREPAPGDGTPRAWALLYGCAEYPDDQATDLWLVPCNVNQVRNTFHEQLGIPWEDMTVRCDEVGVTDDEVTPELVKADIARLAELADGDDVVAIYYCGHGGSTDNTGRGTEYLALSTGPLYDHELKEALDELPCRNVVVILDTCFSGG